MQDSILKQVQIRGIDWTLANAKGMYAFVLIEWTKNNTVVDRIIVARDFFGIKPLQRVTDASQRNIFYVSELNSISEKCDLEGKSIQIEDVLPGTYVELLFSLDSKQQDYTMKMKTTTYSPLLRSVDSWPKNDDDEVAGYALENKHCLKDLANKLKESVALRLPINTPTAMLLSGGLDSSLITAIASDILKQRKKTNGMKNVLRTFNISFTEKGDRIHEINDRSYAKLVSGHLSNVHHTEYTFTAEEGISALANVIHHLETYDVVSVRAGVPLYLLAKYISSLECIEILMRDQI